MMANDPDDDLNKSSDFGPPLEPTMTLELGLVEKVRSRVNAQQGDRDWPYLIVISGPEIGKMHRIEQDAVVVGRASEADFPINDVAVSRRHARLVRSEGDLFIEDLTSANGTYINGQRVTTPRPLKDGDKIAVGSLTVLKFAYHDALEEDFQRRMFEAALRDGLTGAYNKRYFDHQLQAEFTAARRQSSTLSLALLDIDHFKRINDTYGHRAGDAVLRGFHERMRQSLRPRDVFARYGGEEFALLSRDLAWDSFRRLAERLRETVARDPFEHEGQHIAATVSIGIAMFPGANIESAADLVESADQALYAAKRGGRNRVCPY
ncbi:MAG: GGDEF domain-containing protein [Candidatus Competibacterales bacterium]